jgi:hypothetical protein
MVLCYPSLDSTDRLVLQCWRQGAILKGLHHVHSHHARPSGHVPASESFSATGSKKVRSQPAGGRTHIYGNIKRPLRAAPRCFIQFVEPDPNQNGTGSKPERFRIQTRTDPNHSHSSQNGSGSFCPVFRIRIRFMWIRIQPIN